MIAANCWVDGITSDEYHSGTICAGPSISASGLKAIALDCPSKFWVQSALNPNREPKETKALDFGKAAHCLMLGEPTFDAEFAVSPFANFRTDAAKQWRDDEQRVIVSQEDLKVIRAMVDRVRATPQTRNAFRDGVPERSFFWKDPETGIWLKARPDWMPNNPAAAFVQEYKTAVTVRPDKLGFDVFKYGYEIQAALMLDVVAGVLGERPLGIAHIVQEKAPPYIATFKFFDAAQIDRGRRLYRRALRTFAECWERHQAGKHEAIAWPDYTTEPEPFVTPYAVAKEMETASTEGWNA